MPHPPAFPLDADALIASTADSERDPHAAASIPPWVHINDDDEKAPFLTSAPAPTVPNTRHYKPPPKYSVGRKWDHVRESEPPLLSAPIADAQVRWIPFMHSGPNPLEAPGQGVVRSAEWMQQNVAVYGREWEAEDFISPEKAGKGPGGFKGIMYKGKWLISPERQEKSVRLLGKLLLKNPFVPLGLRLVVVVFSAAAVGVAGTILHKVNQVNADADPYNQCAPRASTYLGIIVGSVAMPYVGYLTWDEYFNKPLSLRSVTAKTILLLCDLYFIVFSASNLSLALDALLDDSWACYEETTQRVGDVDITVPRTCPNNRSICRQQQALSGVLVVTLVAWLLCFSVSMLRVVDKLRVAY